MIHFNKCVGVPWNAHQNKNIPFPLLGAAILGGASLVGSAINSFGSGYSARKAVRAQESANETNLQIARETNKANADLWREQTRYNDPGLQMGRLRGAGLNPYMAMSQITPGLAENAPQMQSTSVDPTYNNIAAAADMQKYAQLGNMLPNAIQSAMGAETLQSMEYQNQILKSQAKYSEGMVFQQFIEQMQRNNLLDKQNKNLMMQNFYLPTMSDMTLQQGEQAIRESSERVLSMQAERDVMEVSKRYNIALTNQVNQNIANSIKQLEWNIKEARSRIAANYASSEQSFAAASVSRETKKAVAQQVELFKAETKKTLREAGIIPTGKKADSYVNALVNQAWYNANESKYRGYNQMHQHQDWTNFYNGDQNSGSFGYRFGHTVQNWSPFGSFLH